MINKIAQLKDSYKQHNLTFLGELVVSVAESLGILYITTVVDDGDKIVHCLYQIPFEEYNPNDIEIVLIKN